jgi:hypothetical protein
MSDMRKFNDKNSVSEILGTLLLLIIAVIVVSAVIFTVINSLNDKSEPEVSIVGRLENQNIILEHRGGELLDDKTKMILSIGGRNQTPLGWEQFTINNEAGEDISDLGKWDIGKYLSYKLNDTYKDKFIDVYIVEDESGSVVFYGRLIEGGPLIILGGIWHFDEGEGNTAYDSLNSNDGRVSHPIRMWSTDIKFEGDASMHFNGFSERVRVDHDGTLVLKENITIKASLWPTIGRGFIDSYVIDDVKFGQTPSIVRVNDEMVAVSMENQSKGGTLVTISLEDDGLINDTVDKTNFLPKSAKQLPVQSNIIHLSDDIYVLVFCDAKNDSKLNTIKLRLYSINDDGEINYYDEYIFPDKASLPSKKNPNKPQIDKIDDDTVAVVYTGSNDKGYLYTFNISIGDGIELVNNTFFTNFSYEPSMIRIDDDTIVINYWDGDEDGVIHLVNISEYGEILPGDVYQSFNSDVYKSGMFRVDDDTIVIAYRSVDNEGIIRTLNISSDNIISLTDSSFNISDVEYDGDLFNDDFLNPDICLVRDDLYCLVFSTGIEGTSEGYFLTFRINDNGVISNVSDLILFEEDFCFYPRVVRITDIFVGVVFEGKQLKGTLKTLYIEEVSIPIFDRGFVKKGSYGFWANTSIIYAWVNDKVLSTPVVEDQWNNIVLAYDYVNNTLSLYNNDLINPVETAYYDQPIKYSSSDLLFGYLYSGYIDEIYILDEVYLP